MSPTKSRKDTRAIVALVARYRSPATFEYVQEACCDVSAGGMFIKSESPASAGTLLKLECEADETAKIRGVGRVVWLRQEPNEHGPAGMGVKFVKLETGSKELIAELVERLAEAGIEPRSISAAPETTAGHLAGQSQGSSLAAKSPGGLAPTRSSIPTGQSGSAGSARSSIPTVTRSAMPSVPASFPANKPSTRVRQDNGHGVITAPGSTLGRSEPAQPLATRAGAEPAAETNPAAATAPASQPSAAPALVAVTPAPESERPATIAALPPIEASTPRDGALIDSSAVEDDDAPLPAVRRSALRVWIGIAVGVAVLLAIIFADDRPPSALAPATPISIGTGDAPRRDLATAPAPSEPVQAGERPANARANPATDTPAAQTPSAQVAPAAQPPSAQAAPVTPPPSAQVAPAAHLPSSQVAPPAQPPSAQLAPVAPPPSAQAAPAAQAPTAQVAPAAQAPAALAQHAKDGLAVPAHAVTIPPPSAAVHTPPPEPGAAPSTPAPATPEAGKADARQYVIDFVTRPTGATVTIGELSVVAPGQLTLGTEFPNRVRVIAKKIGYESSSAWIDRAGFDRVQGTFWRRVYMTLPPEAATPPAAPQASPPRAH